jgi:hypothetical protein
LLFPPEKLLDFFRHFDPHNPNHLKAVNELASKLPQELYNSDASWVKIYRTPLPITPTAKESERRAYTGKIDWRDMNCYISKYFTVGEAFQYDSRRYTTNPEILGNILKLAAELDKVREAWGSPIGVTSWYRPESINRAVGGVENSPHLKGYAADIYPMDGSELKFERWLDSYWGGLPLGYGAKAGRRFTHVDLRPIGLVRWDY